MLNYNRLVEESHGLAKDKGWYDTKRSRSEFLMLMVTEIAEASEEIRSLKPAVYQLQPTGLNDPENHTVTPFESDWSPSIKPEGELIEVVDCMIRIADYCGHKSYDLQREVNKVKDLYMGSVGLSRFKTKTPLEQHFAIIRSLVGAYDEMPGDFQNLAMAMVKCEMIHEARGYKIPLETVIAYKHEYNKTRSHRHGGKLL